MWTPAGADCLRAGRPVIESWMSDTGGIDLLMKSYSLFVSNNLDLAAGPPGNIIWANSLLRWHKRSHLGFPVG